MKKRIAILLSMCLILGLFAACGGTAPAAEASASALAPQEEAAAAGAPAEETEPEPAAEAETEEISAEEIAEETEPEIVHLVEFPIEESFSISVSESTTPSLTGSALIGDDGSELGWAKWLQERTGADIEVDLYSFLDATDKQNLMIASGDYTDILVGQLNYAGGVDGAVEEDVLTDIAEYAEYMPDYMNTLFQDVNNVAAAYSTGNHLTAFYGINDPEARADYGPVIRQDWLDELGLQSPETYDELHDVLTEFKNAYDATLWISAYGGVPGDFSGGYGFPEYAGGAGFPTEVKDGQFRFAPVVDGFQDYLRMMHQWYSEGLIYPDFLSQGGSDYPANDLFTGDKIGVWFTYVSYIDAEQTLLEQGTIAPIVWPSLEKGKPCEYGKAPNNSGVDGMGAFSVTTASDDIPLLCAIFNEFYTEDGYDFCNWGTEGETYVVEPDGSRSFTDLIVNDPYSLGANVMMTYYFFKDGPFLYNNERYLASYSDVQLEAANMWTTSRSAAQLSTMTTDQMYESYTLQSDISTVYQEYVVKFIVGDKDIEADWQEFMDQLNGCGLERFLELGQTGVDQYADRLTEVQEIYDSFWNNETP
ncbi:MAG: extracellular solute-binding protein [Oscillospiraceae bacterium]|nr:extracellular solute-binding protein [Oscillospiraceae bacterium]